MTKGKFVNAKILLVDNDKTFLTFCADELTALGHIVKQCASAARALKEVEREVFDVIICDVRLPLGSRQNGGIEVARAAVTRCATSGVIFISGYVTAKEVQDLASIKRFHCLEKGLDMMTHLARLVQTIMTTKYCFVAMPFDKGFDDIHRLGIAAVLEKLSICVVRIDEQQYLGGIAEEIGKAIREASFVVADVTGGNPNVMFEVGYALALSKEVILIANNGSQIPFNVRHRHILMYENVSDLRDRLYRSVTALYS